MTIILAGLNHKTAPVELREQFSFTGCMLQMVLGELQLQVPPHQDGPSRDCAPGSLHEAVILSTCNRLEIYAVTAGDADKGWSAIESFLVCLQGVPVEALHPYLYFMEGQAAIEHLMTVACGLDSLIFGESQIVGQVTQAFADAHAAGATGPILSHLFAQAVHAGKRARTETDISRYTMSISHAAALLAKEKVGELSRAHVLIVGAGEMAELAVQAMKMHGAQDIVCINRTYVRAEELAARLGGRAMNWCHLGEALTWADVVIGATGAPHIVIYAADICQILPQRDRRALIFVDIAVPRDIEKSVGDLPEVQCYDIDDLEVTLDANLAQRQAALPQVQAIVSNEAANFTEWLRCRQVVPVIADLRRKAEAMAEAEVEQALQRLKGLSAHEQEVIIRLGQRLVNKLLHEPTVQLKAQAASGNGYGYAHAIRELFDLSGSDTPSDSEAYAEMPASCDLQCIIPKQTL